MKYVVIKKIYQMIICNIYLISASKHRLWVFVSIASVRRFEGVLTIYINEEVLMNTLNLCSGAEIKENTYPCKPHFSCIKGGVRVGGYRVLLNC